METSICWSFNVDAAVQNNFTTLAAVAHNDVGKVIKGWAKVYEICDPIQAEAAAILWALQITKAENMERTEAIKEGYSTAAWPIQAIICDVVDFSKTFDNCNFN